MKVLVHSVHRVDHAFLKRYPPHLHVSAEGSSHIGDSLPELRPRGTPTPGADGILELDFVVVESDESHSEKLTVTRAETTWTVNIESIRGVSVYSATRRVMVVFAEGER